MMAHIYAHEIHHEHFTKAAKAALNRVFFFSESGLFHTFHTDFLFIYN